MLKKYHVVMNKDKEGFDILYNDPPELFLSYNDAEKALDYHKRELTTRIDNNTITERKWFTAKLHKLRSDDEINEMKWFIEKAFIKEVVVNL